MPWNRLQSYAVSTRQNAPRLIAAATQQAPVGGGGQSPAVQAELSPWYTPRVFTHSVLVRMAQYAVFAGVMQQAPRTGCGQGVGLQLVAASEVAPRTAAQSKA